MGYSMSHWIIEEIADLKQSYSVEPTTSIAIRQGRSVAAIRTKAESLGLSKPRNISEAPRCWAPEQVALLRELYPTTQTGDLAKLLHRTPKRVQAKAAELGLHKTVRVRHPRPEHLRLYRVNEQAFTCLTPEMAYVLGFILADGCVYVTKTNGKILRISSMDAPILEKIRDILQSNHPIDMNYCPVPAIVNNNLVDGLMALGITPNKSLTATLPSIPDELFPHLLRGYFDGDGYVRYGLRQGLTVKFTSGSRILLEQVAERISSNFHLPSRPITNDKGHPTAMRLYYHGSTALRLAGVMYEDAGDLYLPRKRDVFEHYRNVRTRSL